MTFVTRFAPSPTGPLHIGHAYSAILAHDMARVAGGRFLLRIEDIDQARARPEWEQAIYDDLTWLGLTWPEPVLRQSGSAPKFEASLSSLAEQGFLYPCSCSRTDIEAAASAPQEGAPTYGPDGQIYPGTCRARPLSSRKPGDAMRLDMARALATLPAPPSFVETGAEFAGPHALNSDDLIATIGDPVVSRKGGAFAYHLAVVLDDADQGVTRVIRGEDLFEATKIHVVLQRLLGLPTPTYHHHRLIRDETGKRLAKRDDARSIATYRADGATPADIRRVVGL